MVLAIEMGLIGLFVLVLFLLAILAIFLWGLKHAIALIVNSIIGFFALYALKAWLLPDLVINFWSIILVALFGIVGLILVLFLHWIGMWF